MPPRAAKCGTRWRPRVISARAEVPALRALLRVQGAARGGAGRRVVVNHHLLMADIAVRRAQQNWTEAAVLPAYQRLVIDEGHHLEDAAAAHLGDGHAPRRAAPARPAGPAGQGAVAHAGAQADGRARPAERRLAGPRDAAARARRRAGPRQERRRVRPARGPGCRERGEATVRLTEAFDEDPGLGRAGCAVALDDLLGELALLGEGLVLCASGWSRTARTEELASLLAEMRAVGRRLARAGDALRCRPRADRRGPPRVRWVEVRGERARRRRVAQRRGHLGAARPRADPARGPLPPCRPPRS
jgi:ATP-dependent DNA helicase DinG